MQASGSVGGGGEIKVNEAAATEAASNFGTEAEAFAAAMKLLDDMKEELSDWEGEASRAAMVTLAAAGEVGSDIGKGWDGMGRLIVNAQQTFSAADDSAAAKNAAAGK